jgi:two-component system, cell cycle sensor histidine kinase and response regulator CckA
MQQALIMVVEDDPQIGALLEHCLAHEYRVLRCSNGREALEALLDCEGKLDLVLTDVQMPGLSGIELAAEIALRFPALPVIYISGHAEFASQLKSPERRRGFIQKPFAISNLLHEVKQALPPRSGRTNPARC